MVNIDEHDNIDNELTEARESPNSNASLSRTGKRWGRNDGTVRNPE